MPDCTDPVKAKDLCNKHYLREIRHGSAEWEPPGRNVCKVEGCEQFVSGHELCSKHYTAARRRGELPTAGSCVVAGCDLPIHALGRCHKHYLAGWRHGHPLASTRHWGAPYFQIEPEGHWRWIKFIDEQGYGIHTETTAHRWVYEHLIGKLPSGLQVDHICRETDCVNPMHMEPVSPRVNTKRALWAARSPHWFPIWQRIKLQRLAKERGEIKIPEGWSVSEEEAREILKQRRKIKRKAKQ